ncbi:MAG TPA: integrin [Kofleriaceae bacterium]|nr:integrin [Kofleriaceae bacterium]
MAGSARALAGVLSLAALTALTALAACSGGAAGPPLARPGPETEDGQLAGDEDGAGLVACGDCTGSALAQRAYLKASTVDPSDIFSGAVALSADGSTLAVGAIGEDSAATGVGGDQQDNSADFAGAVYVFTRSGATWIQQAYLKASNTEAGDSFGQHVALSADGSTLAVTSSWEASSATGIGGDQQDNSVYAAGAVYVFARSGTTWSQEAYVKASNTDDNNVFGEGLALSGDGSTLAVGAAGEDSAATGIGGDQSDSSAPSSGAVYVFTRSGTTWSQEAYVKASDTAENAYFGVSVALSRDGSTLAVGAENHFQDGADPLILGAGAAYVFTRSGTTWSQEALLQASNPGEDDRFGRNLVLSGDGATLAVTAISEDSAATGIDGDQADNTAPWSGAVYVFARSGTTWAQEAYVKASNTEAGDNFGYSLALSHNGSTLAVGAPFEHSAATGIDGDQADNTVEYSGAAYLFERSGATWTQAAYVKASNTGEEDQFGISLALSRDGSTLVVGALAEDSAATGVDGDQSDNSAHAAGAVYVFGSGDAP